MTVVHTAEICVHEHKEKEFFKMECFVVHPHEIGLMFQKKHELRAAPRSKKKQTKQKYIF